MHLFRFLFYCFFLKKKKLQNFLIRLNYVLYQQVVFVDGNGLFHYRGKFHFSLFFYFILQHEFSLNKASKIGTGGTFLPFISGYCSDSFRKLGIFYTVSTLELDI